MSPSGSGEPRGRLCGTTRQVRRIADFAAGGNRVPWLDSRKAVECMLRRLSGAERPWLAPLAFRCPSPTPSDVPAIESARFTSGLKQSKLDSKRLSIGPSRDGCVEGVSLRSEEHTSEPQ